jgi:hypothetical protein
MESLFYKRNTPSTIVQYGGEIRKHFLNIYMLHIRRTRKVRLNMKFV